MRHLSLLAPLLLGAGGCGLHSATPPAAPSAPSGPPTGPPIPFTVGAAPRDGAPGQQLSGVVIPHDGWAEVLVTGGALVRATPTWRLVWLRPVLGDGDPARLGWSRPRRGDSLSVADLALSPEGRVTRTVRLVLPATSADDLRSYWLGFETEGTRPWPGRQEWIGELRWISGDRRPLVAADSGQ